MAVLRVRVSVAWWLRPYLWALATVAVLSGRTPDADKLGKVMRRAVRMTVGG